MSQISGGFFRALSFGDISADGLDFFHMPFVVSGRVIDPLLPAHSAVRGREHVFPHKWLLARHRCRDAIENFRARRTRNEIGELLPNQLLARASKKAAE